MAPNCSTSSPSPSILFLWTPTARALFLIFTTIALKQNGDILDTTKNWNPAYCKWGPWTSSISIPQKLVSNTEASGLTRTLAQSSSQSLTHSSAVSSALGSQTQLIPLGQGNLGLLPLGSSRGYRKPLLRSSFLPCTEGAKGGPQLQMLSVATGCWSLLVFYPISKQSLATGISNCSSHLLFLYPQYHLPSPEGVSTSH